MSRNKSGRRIMFASVTVVILTFMFLLFGQGLTINYLPSQAFAVAEDEQALDDGDYIGVPAYGYFACHEGDELVNTQFEEFGSEIVTCKGSTGQNLIQECTVNVQLPGREELDGIPNARFLYKICNQGEDCDLNKGESIPLKDFGVARSQLGASKSFELTEDEFIKIELQTSTFLVNVVWKVGDEGKYRVYYRPFMIYRQDMFRTDSGVIPDTEDCDFEGRVDGYSKIIETTSRLTKDIPTNEYSEITIQERGATYPYLTNTVAIVPQYNLFDDGTKYCTQKKIYEVGTVTLNNGDTYRVVDTGSNNVVEDEEIECCDGGDVERDGYYCSDDFTIEPLQDSIGAECQVASDCPLVSYTFVEGGALTPQDCVNGECTEPDRIDTECSFDSDCAEGHCVRFPNNPRNNYCKEPEPVKHKCGNRKCEEQYGETVDSCPEDCAVIPPAIDIDWTLVGIASGFAIVIIIMIYFGVKRGGGRNPLL